MKMVEVKTAELIGPALDWAVAKAVGLPMEIEQLCCGFGGETGNDSQPFKCCEEFSYVMRWPDGTHYQPSIEPGDARHCRAIVAAQLGDVVSVPAELINGGGL